MQNSITLLDVTPDATQHNPAVRLAKGRFQRWRRAICIPLIGLFLLAPWLTLNGAPLLWMDLQTRELHLLGISLWPDDLLALTWLGFASAFGLFSVATMAGRLWCGFACPQTVWSMMFTWVEEKVQGSRQQRLKSQNLSWREKPWLALLTKHSLWLSISFITGFTFVAFFETGAGLAQAIINAEANASVWFWLIFFTALTYINGGWLREQVCLHMCPYSRFQSVMLDQKSLKVSYDVERGEPRLQKLARPDVHINGTSAGTGMTVSLKHSLKNLLKEPAKKGDCVDCTLCVQVCPVGIDIRQGLQYACIDCGACIDACDAVMDKIKAPRGLIRFDNPQMQKNDWKSLFTGRAKLWGYASLALLCVVAFVLQISFRETLDLHISRDRGQMFVYNGAGELANRFSVKMHNKTTEPMELALSVSSQEPAQLSITGQKQIKLGGGESRSVSVEVQCTYPCASPLRNPIWVNVKNRQTQKEWPLKQMFYRD